MRNTKSSGAPIGLPVNPTPEELTYYLKRGIGLPHGTSGGGHAMDHISSYLCLSQIKGTPMTAQALKDYVRRFDWRKLFVGVAQVAAVLANDPAGHKSEFIESTVRNSIVESAERTKSPVWLLMARHVTRYAEGAIAHEQAIYFLEAMAIVYGSENDAVPSDAEIGLLFLAANDYLAGWERADSRALDELECMVAEFCNIARYNHYPDPLRSLVDASTLFSRRPAHRPYAVESKWWELQNEAFGCSVGDYIEKFAIPLVLITQGWGKAYRGEQPRPPLINTNGWFSETKLPARDGAAFVSKLALNRAEMKKERVNARLSGSLERCLVLRTAPRAESSASGARRKWSPGWTRLL